jgi:hypothetical protein
MNGDAAQKLLERMRKSPSGWGQTDFERLLDGFGFKWREGGKHRFYFHPRLSKLKISVPRHNTLKEWVARDAVKLIDELTSLSKAKEGTDATND